MKREFSRREKILLLILAILVLAIVYIKVVFEPVNEQVETFNALAMEEQTEIEGNIVLLGKKKQMEAALEELKGEETAQEIPAYDNSNALMKELHTILANTNEYAVDFSVEKEKDGYIVLRPVEMSFNTSSYSQARDVIDKLSAGNYPNQISDVNIRKNSNSNTFLTTLTVTYFEIQ